MRLFVAGVLCLHLFLFISLRERIKQGYPDFTVYYTAATILRHGLGHQLYDAHVQYEVQKKSVGVIAARRSALPYIHPPFEALIFLPLTYLPYPQAFAAWDALNVGALFGAGLLLRKFVKVLGRMPAWEFVLGSLAFFPVFVCFLQGQDSVLLLLLCGLGFNALKKRADLLAGCWFALGMFKFQFVLPVVLLIGIWKWRRAAIGFVGVSVLLVLTSVGLAGWGSLLRYPEFALQIANDPGLGGVAAEFAPNLRGLALGWPLHLSRTVGSAVALVGSVLLLVFAAWKGRRRIPHENLELRFALAVIVSVLIAWQTNMHDLCLLVLPAVLVADYCVRVPTQRAEKLVGRFGLLLPVLPLLISPLWLVLWIAEGAVNLMAIPLLWWVGWIGKKLSHDNINLRA
ncbi:MAG: glycosyltransferase family 87 protein [Candidatus Sulfotelmatobacter sp.]